VAYILFADDEPETVQPAADFFASQGHQVAVAPGGQEAQERIRQRPPDILVVDLMMPFLDGFLVVRELRERHPTASTQVVLLTTICADGQPGREWRCPVDAYVLRSAGPWQIVLAVEQLLNRDVRPKERPDAESA
jgi:DNA-binding response OmpR family regulator